MSCSKSPQEKSTRVDIDALRQSHKDQWERLGKLASKRILSAKETDELISLYGQVGQQLSAVRSQARP